MRFDALERARERWGELLAADAGAPAASEQPQDRLAELGIVAGGRPLCTVLQPHLITEEQLKRQSKAAALICSAAIKVRDGILADERMHRLHLGPFMEWVGELVELDATPIADGALMRLDASLAGARLHFLELNADSPAGAGHHDSILDFFTGLPAFEQFAAEHRARPLALVPSLLDCLLAAWRSWGGTGTPTITAMTRTDDPLRVSGLEVEVDRYRRAGVSARMCDFRELSFEGGRLRAGDHEIKLLYRVMPTAECLDAREELKPLFAAVRSGAVCMVNPFRSELLGHKALFALMTDPDHSFGFEAAERAAIREHVPWARQLADGTSTDEQGHDVDLVEHVLSERENLVLKPAHQFGGIGVRLGWREEEPQWRQSVQRALDADYIVQRRVQLHRAEYPTLEEPGSSLTYYEDTDPFLFRGTAAGILTRLSRDEVTNVHAGGSVVASFAIDPPADHGADVRTAPATRSTDPGLSGRAPAAPPLPATERSEGRPSPPPSPSSAGPAGAF